MDSGAATGRTPFTIKWLAASHDATVRGRLEEGLASRGHSPTILEYTTPDALLESMGKDRTNILVISAAMTAEASLESTVHKITRQYPLDVLFYGLPVDAVAKSRLGASSTVTFADSQDPVDAIVAMADESPKWQNPRFIRGLLISRALDLEGALVDCIVRRLSIGKPMPQGDDLEDCHAILYERNLQLAQKWSILKLIMTLDGAVDEELLKLIESVGTARNRIAHVRLGIDDSGTVVSDYEFHKDQKKYRFDADMLWKTVGEADEAILRLGGMIACMDAHEP